MKIVLAIDGSEYSDTAVEEFSKMPFPYNTEVRIISVFENPMLAAPGVVPFGGSTGNYYEEVMSNAKKKRKKYSKECQSGIAKEERRFIRYDGCCKRPSKNHDSGRG